MTNRTSPQVARTEAPSLRERAGRLRDAAGRFIKRAAALAKVDQPEQASLLEGKAASPAAGTFSAPATSPDHADRGHPEAPERDRAEGGQEPRREHDMGRHESFKNAVPHTEDVLSRLLTRPAGQGEANPSRRALVAGSVAAAIPLPVLARAAAPAAVAVEAPPLVLPALVAAPHPDRALLDIATAYSRAREAEELARNAAAAAADVVDAVAERRPIALVPSYQDWSLTCGRARPLLGGSKPLFRYIHIDASALPEDHQRWQHAWTGDGLRSVIARAVPALGRGGQTPHYIRRWRSLLPIAEAFDAEVAAARTLTDYARLCAEHRDARDRAQALYAEALRTVATTPEGLAVQVRLLVESNWMKQGGAYAILMQSAAAVAGVKLPESDFDVPAWVAAWERCGGRIDWIPRRHGQDELAFVYPSLINAAPDMKAEVRRVSEERTDNSVAIDRWLRANR